MYRLGYLAYRLRLARKRRLIDFQRTDGNDTRIGRDLLALLHDEHISAHDFPVGDDHLLPVAHHRRRRFHEFLERTESVLRSPFLYRADNRIEEKHGEDDGAVNRLAHEKDDGARKEQDVDERALELPQKDKPTAVDFCFGQSVGTFVSQPPGSLSRAEPTLMTLQRFKDCRQFFFVPERYHGVIAKRVTGKW